MKEKFNVSQSLMKAFAEYKMGNSCGLQFKAQYLDKVPFPPSEAMQLGNYFEFLCLGKKNRDGSDVEPERTLKGEPTAKYRYAIDQAATFKKTIDKMGWKITGKDTYYSKDNASMLVDAEIDTGNGEIAFLDTKFSGLINNKWEAYGWDLEKLPTNEILTIQPIHYKWLYRELTGKIPEFFWYIASSTNSTEAKLIRAHVEEWKIDQHGEYVTNVRGMVQSELRKGFIARPEIKRCGECPLKHECPQFTETPLLTEITI